MWCVMVASEWHNRRWLAALSRSRKRTSWPATRAKTQSKCWFAVCTDYLPSDMLISIRCRRMLVGSSVVFVENRLDCCNSVRNLAFPLDVDCSHVHVSTYWLIRRFGLGFRNRDTFLNYGLLFSIWSGLRLVSPYSEDFPSESTKVLK